MDGDNSPISEEEDANRRNLDIDAFASLELANKVDIPNILP